MKFECTVRYVMFTIFILPNLRKTKILNIEPVYWSSLALVRNDYPFKVDYVFFRYLLVKIAKFDRIFHRNSETAFLESSLLESR